jgi:hypothetical protein
MADRSSQTDGRPTGHPAHRAFARSALPSPGLPGGIHVGGGGIAARLVGVSIRCPWVFYRYRRWHVTLFWCPFRCG